jgi:hypothetical protein
MQYVLDGLGENGYSGDTSAPIDGGFSSDTSVSLQQISDTGALTATDLSAPGYTQINVSSPAIAVDPTSQLTPASSNPFLALLTGLGTGAALAAGQVAAGAINTAELNAINAQRLAQGLPPQTIYGHTMTAAQMAAAGYSPAQIAAVQSQLGISPSTLMVLAALGIGAFLLMSGKSRSV